MKKNVFLMALLMMLSSLISVNSYAEEANSAEDAIKAECKDESQGAESPEIYYEECVSERLQVLKDEQQGSGDMPSERG